MSSVEVLIGISVDVYKIVVISILMLLSLCTMNNQYTSPRYYLLFRVSMFLQYREHGLRADVLSLISREV